MTATALRLGPESLRKRDGRVVSFDLHRLQRSLQTAGDMTGEYGPAMAWMVAQQIEVYLADLNDLDTDTVQDMMEEQLMEAGYYHTARACILYRERRRVARLKDGALPAA